MIEKLCRRCNTVKPASMFSVRKKTKDGLQSECKSCISDRYKENRDAIRERQKETWQRYADENGEKLKEKNRVRRIATVQQASAYREAYKAKYAPKVNAKNVVWSHLLTGRLQKMPCEICADPVSDAHHDDYAKPLEIRWLCRRHHAQWHAKHGAAPNGETK